MTRCPFCQSRASAASLFRGWTCCPVPCGRLLRGPGRGQWVLFQLPASRGRVFPHGARLVHAAGPPFPGRLWRDPGVGDWTVLAPDVPTPDSGRVRPGTFKAAVREIVRSAPSAERTWVARHVMSL
jgi:hypothetical protein